MDVTISDGKKELIVSDKAFDVIYKPKGFTLVGRVDDEAAPTALAPGEEDPAEGPGKAIAKSASKALRIVGKSKRKAAKRKGAKKAPTSDSDKPAEESAPANES